MKIKYRLFPLCKCWPFRYNVVLYMHGASTSNEIRRVEEKNLPFNSLHLIFLRLGENMCFRSLLY